MNQFKIAGFTLIELLIVVAIIGVLASVVLVATGGAKGKGANGGIKSQLVHARSQAEIFFNTNTGSPNTYTGVCGTTVVGGATPIGSYIQKAAQISGLSTYTVNGTGTATTATCNVSGTGAAYAAEVPLIGGGMWCVDSTAKSEQNAASFGAGTAC